MLKTIRSQSAIKALGSSFKVESRQQSSQFSTKYHLVIPNIPYNEPQIVPRRFVHQTSKTNQTTLLNSKRSEFALMSLNSLKQECRKRGLKVSGRKAELALRIATFETSFNSSPEHSHELSTLSRPKASSITLKSPVNIKKFSNTSKVLAKGDDSHIDFIKPVDIEPPQLVPDDYIIKIPSISTEASRNLVTKLEKELANPKLKQTIVSKAEGSSGKIFEQGSIEHIEQQNKSAEEVGQEVIEPEAKKEFLIDEPYVFDHSEIPSRDKTFWGSALAVIGGLFVIKSVSGNKKHKHRRRS